MEMYNPPHPGEILKDIYMEPLNLTFSDVAKGIGVTQKALLELINKKISITPIIAIKLAKAFNTTPESWLSLQDQYDLWHAKKRAKISDIQIFVHSKDKIKKVKINSSKISA